MLFPMCDDLKRDFYSACPVWYWPVLWWQFVVMERYLADLHTARGGGEMAYGLALGPRGQLRLIFVSDAACRAVKGRGGYVEPVLAMGRLGAEYTQPACIFDSQSPGCCVSKALMAPTCATRPPIHIDPG